MPSKTSVAIKMEPTKRNDLYPNQIEYCYDHEIAALKAIGAINNKTIEEWNIPMVYAFGEFIDYNYIVIPWLQHNIFHLIYTYRKNDLHFQYHTVLVIILKTVHYFNHFLLVKL